MIKRRCLRTRGIRTLVLDEADEMLDLGFRDELETLLKQTPDTRRTLLFSATIPREIAALAKRYQRDALRIDTVSGTRQHADIEYRAVIAGRNDEEHAVVNVLRYFESPTAMVFCSTREMVRHMHGSLLERGFASVALSGELSQSERSRALESLRTGQARVCVATDVAARGLDLPDLGLVVHAALPTDSPTLLHRSGRTGRAGRKGTCVIIVPISRRRKAEQLLAGAASRQAGAVRRRRRRSAPATARGCWPIRCCPRRWRRRIWRWRRACSRAAPPREIAAALIRMHRARLPEPRRSRSRRRTSPSIARVSRPTGRALRGRSAPASHTGATSGRPARRGRASPASGTGCRSGGRTRPTRNGWCR